VEENNASLNRAPGEVADPHMITTLTNARYKAHHIALTSKHATLLLSLMSKKYEKNNALGYQEGYNLMTCERIDSGSLIHHRDDYFGETNTSPVPAYHHSIVTISKSLQYSGVSHSIAFFCIAISHFISVLLCPCPPRRHSHPPD